MRVCRRSEAKPHTLVIFILLFPVLLEEVFPAHIEQRNLDLLDRVMERRTFPLLLLDKLLTNCHTMDIVYCFLLDITVWEI
jgi:hypothetical protein